MKMNLYTNAAVLAVAFACFLRAADADFILHGGRIVTLDASNSIAQAIAFKNGRIAAVGTTASVLENERGDAGDRSSR
jgi:predicted amidohydrolase YtcJ